MGSDEKYLDSLLESVMDDGGNSIPPADDALPADLFDFYAAHPGGVSLMPEPVAEEPVPEEPVIEEPVPEEPVSEEPILEETVIEEPVAVDTFSEDYSSGEDFSFEDKALFSDEIPSEDKEPEDSLTGDVPSDDVLIADIPTESIPMEDILVEDIPMEDFLVEDIPVEDTPAEDIPADNITSDGDFSFDDTINPSEDIPSEDIPSEGDLFDPFAENVSDEISGEKFDIDSLMNFADDGDISELGDISNAEGFSIDSATPEENAELDELLQPTQSKEEIKAKKKEEKELAKQAALLEKQRKKEEKARLKEEKAARKKAAKESSKSVKEEIPEDYSEIPIEDTGVSESEDSGEIDPFFGLSEEEVNELDSIPDVSEVKGKKAQGKKDKKNISADGEEKKGFFGKILGALFEDAEDEEEEAESKGELKISDENKEILEGAVDDSADSGKGKKNKKKVKDKKKKEKEPGEEGEGEEGEDSGKGKKAKKEKPKKEKKVKEKPEADKEDGKKLPKKKVFVIFAFCITIGVVIIIVSTYIPSFFDKKAGREAYYQGDLQTVYEKLGGEKLSESDEILYERAIFALALANKYDAYMIDKRLGENLKALNDLFSGIRFYLDQYDYATKIGALEDMEAPYRVLVNELQETYGISEDRARVVASMDELAYNRELYYLVNGVEFTIPDYNEPEDPEVMPMQVEDLLPGEDSINIQGTSDNTYELGDLP